MKVRQVSVERLILPLQRPYRIAHGTVVAYDLFLVRIDFKENYGYGEVVPLPGYCQETPLTVWEDLLATAADLPGVELDVACEMVRTRLFSKPFAASALMNALDLGIVSAVPGKIPLVGIVGGDSPQAAVDSALALKDKGYRALKMKVGISPQDLVRVEQVAAAVGDSMPLRLDANEAFSRQEADNFLAAVGSVNSIEYLEQPIPRSDWEGLKKLSGKYPQKIMLDESIWDESDILRAVKLSGCQWIKLKEGKTAGTENLIRLSNLALSLGIRVIIGNGVAAGISCWREGLAWNVLYPAEDGPPGEMNGYLKPVESILENPLGFSEGYLTYPACYSPIVDEEIVTRYRQERRLFK